MVEFKYCPTLQAVFNVEVLAPPGHTVLFNMPPRAVHHVSGSGAWFCCCACVRCVLYSPFFIWAHREGNACVVCGVVHGA